ncbi:nucleotide disphospho-sugar-binding domain-containing protein [Actinomyces sp. ZJ308]|uniref:glycosyltransferase n=1 Tax=Actinomyces sp. ZJ308 TaxID=2708342 RepID=UPI0014212B59|nr:nucleotide disphospho-sugar-binding domain-containing protein [Actinomyces sp. ZJ308]
MPEGAAGHVVTVRRSTSRVLFAPETFNFAEVTRAIEVARRMPSDVECVFAGFSRRNSEYIRAAGFEFRLLTPYLSDEEGRLALAFDQGRSLRHPFTAQMLTQRVTSERVLLRCLRPDAVVIGVTPSQFISARAECVPLVFVRPFAYSLAHLEAARKVGATGFLPRTTPEECLIDDAASHLLHAAGTRLPLSRAFHQVARANGVSLPQGLFAGLTADLNLIASTPHLLPRWLEMPEGHRVVGPVYAHLPGEVPEIVADLAAGPQPLVYFAMGSSGNRDLVLSVLRGLGQADCQVLAPVRSHIRDEDLDTLPLNVHVTDWIPAHQLGDAVDLAITHGGEGTVQTSCAQGWPFIGIPLQLEQRFNVQRCTAFGSARLVSQSQARRADWAELVHQALADDVMRSRARHMAELMEGLDGPGRAAAAICELL